MKSFAEKVREAAGKIPKGKVATYGQLAQMSGNDRASRAVGMIMSKNRDTKAVPCHRVVASDGRLTGYAFGKGIPTKKDMLTKEGVKFLGEKIDLASSQWRSGQSLV